MRSSQDVGLLPRKSVTLFCSLYLWERMSAMLSSTLFSMVASASSLFAAVPLTTDQPDKTIDILMLLLMVLQILLGVPASP